MSLVNIPGRRMDLTFQVRRDDSVDWATKNPILKDGEPGLETDTGRLRIGDGISEFAELDYFIPSDELRMMIDEAMSAGTGAPVSVELAQHINNLTPHPVYDEGPSFLLLYQNAKV